MTEQRVAVVTGGSRGIGRAVAVKLAAQGAAVVVGYAGAASAASEVVDAVIAAGGQAVAAQADVADEGAVSAMFDVANERFGGVDVVVNSAGRMTLSTIAELNLDDLDAMHRTNIAAPSWSPGRRHGASETEERSSPSPPRWSACSSPPTADMSPARAPSRR